jgi:hypothetical protein
METIQRRSLMSENEQKPKIYESPDKGKTIYERDFGSIERTLVKTAIQQQWNITFNGTPVSDEDCRRINL